MVKSSGMLLTKDQIKNKLKEIFGYDTFRDHQQDIINNLLAEKDSLVIMPTGAGKSLCYQLPAILMQGTALIISPLISLMKNQVDQLNVLRVRARFINSTLSKAETEQVKEEVLLGAIKLLYVAPEALSKTSSIHFLKQVNISFLAIDEAHCISEWGHDFRPEYRKIWEVFTNTGKVAPIMALTATATRRVQSDIKKNLKILRAKTFRSSFNRKNLFYEVVAKRHPHKLLIKILQSHAGKSGIIYCMKRKKVEELVLLLKKNHIAAVPYHAGMKTKERMESQDLFLNEKIKVIVATIAFGMGINKSDVRFVIHYDAPKSLEGYYQETGRAGRDNRDSMCTMLYDPNDLLTIEKIQKEKEKSGREHGKLLLEEVANYAESPCCRRKHLLAYFGEDFDDSCGHCDNCVTEANFFDATSALQAFLRYVSGDSRHLGKGLRSLANTLSENLSIQNVHSQEQKKHSPAFWKGMLTQAFFSGFLEKNGEINGFMLTNKSEDFLEAPYTVEFKRAHEDFLGQKEKGQYILNEHHGLPYNEELYCLLVDLRKKIAKEHDLPPYVIFQDQSLEDMATSYPITETDFLKIMGVGSGKMHKFGQAFLTVIQDYLAKNEDIIPVSHLKSSNKTSRLKINIIRKTDKRVPLEDIAKSLYISFPKLLEEIEKICFQGVKVSIGYYLDMILEKHKQESIYECLRGCHSDDLHEVIDELDDEYTYEEVQLVRIKFLSEIAN